MLSTVCRQDVNAKERVLAAVVFLKSMSQEFKPLSNVVLQNQLIVPLGSYSYLQQQFGVLVMNPCKLQLLQAVRQDHKRNRDEITEIWGIQNPHAHIEHV